jgi:penicillin-binding protein 2
MARQPERAFVRPRRFAAIAVLIPAVLVVLSVRLWDLQIVRGAEYRALAEQNRIVRLPVPADRGVILDRNRTVLARNQPGFSVSILPVDLPRSRERELAERLGAALGREPSDLLQLVAAQRLRNPYEPVRVSAKPVARELALLLVEHASLFPGVGVSAESIRFYEEAALYAPLLGYVGPITEGELEERRDAGYLLQDVVGRAGLERVYEHYLRGTYGWREVERDAAQREIRTLAQVSSQPGSDLVLTLDHRLQALLAAELQKGIDEDRFSQGVGLAMNPQNGEILAMVTVPGYDNNMFIRGITPDEMKQLNAADYRPLVNKAIAEIYPPGSTYKMVTALGALQEGTANRNTRISVGSNVITVGGFRFFDWRAHGTLDFVNGFAYSSDIFFYTLAGGYGGFPGIGPDKMHEYARMLGFGERTGIDLPGEVRGINPSPAWKQEALEEDWTIGNTYHAAIGQGLVAVTPIQLLNAYAAVANGGKLYRPHLLKAVVDTQGSLVHSEQPQVIRTLPIAPENLRIIREGARRVVTTGMAFMPNPKVVVAGKTGTAEFGASSGTDSLGRQLLGFHNWFVSYVPKANEHSTDAEIAMLVFTFNSSKSACASCVSPAVSLTQRVYEAYFGHGSAERRPAGSR